MHETRIEAELQNFFRRSSSADWEKIAVQETGGEDPFDKLSWRGRDGLLFMPYYDATNESNTRFISHFAQPGTEPRRSLNLPLLNTDDPRRANADALDHLMQGADGIVYDLRASNSVDLKVLINKIEWPLCYIGFYPDDNHSLIQSIQDTIQNNFPPSTVNGAFFWEKIPKRNGLDFYFASCPSFRALGLLIGPSSPAEEVCDALLKGVRAFETFSADSNAGSVFSSIAFSMRAEPALLESVAKFRALRMLWFQVARAYGFSHYNPQDVFLHARSEFVPDGTFGPHENMLSGTYSAMTAIMGGCSGITVESDPSYPFAKTWARNVSSIVNDESFFYRVNDPLAGAWTVDAVISAIAQKAWTLFQQKSRRNETA